MSLALALKETHLKLPFKALYEIQWGMPAFRSRAQTFIQTTVFFFSDYRWCLGWWWWGWWGYFPWLFLGKYKSHNHRHHLLYYKEIKSSGRKESKERKKKKNREETHMGIAGIKSRLKVEQTLSVLWCLRWWSHFLRSGGVEYVLILNATDIRKSGEFN